MEIQNISVDTLVKGYELHEDRYKCLFCSQQFQAHEVFPMEGRFFTAEGMMKNHMEQVHTSPFHALLALDKKVTGLSDVQLDMLQYFFEGKSDQEIVAESNLTSVSTVRQHRFKLREKEKQAKIFIALMQLMKNPELYTIHKGARQVDERYSIEEKEREKVLATYFKHGLDGGIDTIPSKEKKKLILLQHILKRFDMSKRYSEKEVNEILKTVNADFVSLRRHLIEYGFMERSNDGSEYWVKK
ncbi:DUF2087 domain-containing protein [Solibacillus palustris]|uniref:DUF2087 domain-containing protein n=1 Tax=Solibacillus palustris TaxID=2908203 RepID=UPI002104FECD|nr:DUF2087 domain-containing protein [Solibacillus sp. MA9]